jgi:hypothetical protein
MIFVIENVAVDLVNIRFDFMLLGSNSKPAAGEFTSLLTEPCMPNNHERNRCIIIIMFMKG